MKHVMSRVRIATIGRSAITQRFLEALQQVDSAVYVGAYSRSMSDAQEFAAAHGGHLAFANLEDLAASDEVDAVYIASPNALHAVQAQALLAAGKHVLVEKTFAANEREAQEVFTAASAAGCVALEATRNLFGPGIPALTREMQTLGPLRKATIRFSKITSRILAFEEKKRVSIFDPQHAAGALMDIGVYCVEPAVALFGAPLKIMAAGVVQNVPGYAENDAYGKIDLCGDILLQYADHVVNLSYGKVSDDVLPCEIEGQKATITWSDTSVPHTITKYIHEDKGMVFGGTPKAEPQVLRLDLPQKDMQLELECFVRAIAGEHAALAEVARHQEITLASLKIMDEVRRQLGVRFPADDAFGD